MSNKNPRVNSVAPSGYVVYVPLVCYNIVGKMSDGVRLFVIDFVVGAMFDFEDLSELSLGFQS